MLTGNSMSMRLQFFFRGLSKCVQFSTQKFVELNEAEKSKQKSDSEYFADKSNTAIKMSLSESCAKALSDKTYEKRKLAAQEVEK